MPFLGAVSIAQLSVCCYALHSAAQSTFPSHAARPSPDQSHATISACLSSCCLLTPRSVQLAMVAGSERSVIASHRLHQKRLVRPRCSHSATEWSAGRRFGCRCCRLLSPAAAVIGSCCHRRPQLASRPSDGCTTGQMAWPCSICNSSFMSQRDSAAVCPPVPVHVVGFLVSCNVLLAQ